MLVRVVSLLKRIYGRILYPAVLLYGVRSRCEGQDGLVIGGKTRKTQLGQIMDKEIELCCHTAQAGFNQPIRKR